MQVQDIVDSVLRRKKTTPPAGLTSPPQLSGALPLLGHSVEFIQSTIELLSRANRELGEVAAFSVFNRRMVAVFGPEAHEAVFRAPDAVLSPSEAYKIMTPVFGKDIVYDAPPEKMAEQLKMLLPALKDKRMRTYGEAVVRETEESIEEWGQSGVLDFVAFCRVLTNFTSSRCLLGREFREGMNEEFAAVYHDLERGVTPLAYVNAHLPIPSFWKRDRARVRMVEMINKVVAARRRDQRTGEDFLQTLMESKYSDGRSLSEHEITGLLLAAMFAGHHTSSVTTAWTLLELLSHPAELRRCVDEIDRVFAGGQPVTHAALRELNVVEAAVKEALRMHPPLFLLVRVARQDFTYKQWFIAKGTWILVSPTVSHRLPEVFRDPDRFDPDRFAPPREEDKRDFAYIAFGGGRHKCLGNAFAILQIKAILAMLLGQYEFELAGDPIESDFAGLVVTPKEPCRVRYRRRAQPSVSMRAAGELARVAAADENAAAAGGCPVPHGQAQPQASGCPVPHGNGAAASHGNGAAQAHAHGNGAAEAHARGNGAATVKSLRIVLDRDLCQGHAVCVGESPQLFKIGADGKVETLDATPPPSLHERARAAARYCPTRAIKLQEE
jgi:sterol 14-demethylase